MAKQLQLRRGTNTENNAFTGASGEITFDTTNNRIRIHNGSQPGGFPIPRNNEVVHNSGTEEVNGYKTFKNNITLNASNPHFHLVNTDVELPNANTGEEKGTTIRFADKNNSELGYVRHVYYTSGGKNYGQMQIITVDPDPTHYNFRVVTSDNSTYVHIYTDYTNNYKRYYKEGESKTVYYYTPGSESSSPAINTNIYSDEACTVSVGTITTRGCTRVYSNITLDTNGTTAKALLSFNPATSSNDTQIATTKFVHDILDIATPVGMIAPYGGTTAPTGWLMCNGQAVSRTTYSALYGKIGTAYGAGDGSTTFNLPNYTDRVAQGLGRGYVAAGLPNITGHTRAANNTFYGDDSAGALYHGGAGYCNGQDYNVGGTYFDASRSNSIYGNSSTVQPPAVKSYWIIKY